jgi:hypothetical protein
MAGPTVRLWLLTALLLAVVPTARDASAPAVGPDAAQVHAAAPAPHESLAPPPSFAAPSAPGLALGLDLRERASGREPLNAFSRPGRHPRLHRPALVVIARHLPYARALARARSGAPATFCHPPPHSVA